jgi:serine/threonine protein kinase
VRLLYYNQKNGFFLQEYVDGVTMRDVAKTDNVERWLMLYKKILNTLKNIRTAYPGFRHNDLKADNVLVRGDEPVLIDFEYASSPCGQFTCKLIEEDHELCEDYGLSAEGCDAYDPHTLLIDSLMFSGPQLSLKIKEIFEKTFGSEHLQFTRLNNARRLGFADQRELSKRVLDL